jgi:aldehyde:ferredoxin oxidoreductase
MKSFYGTVLEVNLTNRQHRIYDLDNELLNKYVGGSGIATKLLIDNTDDKTDPLGPDNILIFSTGPLTGTPVPSSGRHAIVSKSPLTGIYCESDVGGYWGYNLRKAGFDILVMKGKASSPVYLWINNRSVEIRPASHLWGKDTIITDEIIKEETNKKVVVASIGSAGENKVLLSSIIHDGSHGRAAGRGGLGAVMGSKNLKSIAVFGDKNIQVYDIKGLRDSIKNIAKDMVKKSKGNMDYGTAGYVEASEELGELSIKNWQMRNWPNVKKISGGELAKFVQSSFHCQSCFVGCGRVVPLKINNSKEEFGGGPEYESVALLGANCLIDDMEIVIEANELCNRYGMDTISVGSVVAFAMEAYEKGLLKGIAEYPILWGDGNVLIKLIHEIGMKKGIGKLLGQGVKKMAEILGRDAQKFAIHVKGLEFPAHDPRACASSYLGFATSNRGACHLQAFSHAYELGNTEPPLGIEGEIDRYSDEGKAELVIKSQNLMSMYDSIKICKFLIFSGVHVDQVVLWFNLATGRNIGLDNFMEIGSMLFNLKRSYNQMCGISKKDEIIPPRILSDGLSKKAVNFNKMLQEYYYLRGYDKEVKLK